MNEREALIMLNSVEGIGPIRLKKLLKHFNPPQTVFGKPLSELTAIGLPETVAHVVLETPRQFDVEREVGYAEREGAKIITLLDEDYPKALKDIHDSPPVLYVKGEFYPEKELFFAMVGSRNASPYGLEMADRIARELAACGFTIVSGFARGIDTASHRGALSAKGRTVAVLGSGLLDIYPRENRALARELSFSGALVSEFPLMVPPLSENFPRRNRIISGLSLGVLVIEADEKSGALITAHCAVEQGKEVFALPGRVDSSLSRGTHRLIQEGAKLFQDLNDIFEELKIPIAHEASKHSFVKERGTELPGEEGVVYETLTELPKSIDAIVEETHLSAKETLATLVQLEVKHLVRVYPGNHYTRT